MQGNYTRRHTRGQLQSYRGWASPVKSQDDILLVAALWPGLASHDTGGSFGLWKRAKFMLVR